MVGAPPNGLPFPHKDWVAQLDGPSGRYFFVDKSANPAVVTWWVCTKDRYVSSWILIQIEYSSFRDDPRTAEVETAPAAPGQPAPPQAVAPPVYNATPQPASYYTPAPAGYAAPPAPTSNYYAAPQGAPPPQKQGPSVGGALLGAAVISSVVRPPPRRRR
jgi:hypothetical protein